jgi:hypothetical protein
MAFCVKCPPEPLKSCPYCLYPKLLAGRSSVYEVFLFLRNAVIAFLLKSETSRFVEEQKSVLVCLLFLVSIYVFLLDFSPRPFLGVLASRRCHVYIVAIRMHEWLSVIPSSVGVEMYVVRVCSVQLGGPK